MRPVVISLVAGASPRALWPYVPVISLRNSSGHYQDEGGDHVRSISAAWGLVIRKGSWTQTVVQSVAAPIAEVAADALGKLRPADVTEAWCGRAAVCGRH